VNIELYQTIVSHFQQKGLACLLVRDIGALHDFVDFECFSRSALRIFSRSFSMIKLQPPPTGRAHEPSRRERHFQDAKIRVQKSRPDARALTETTQSPNRSPLERGTEIFDTETNAQMGPSAKQRPPAETHADAKSLHSGAINAKGLTKVSTQGLGGGRTRARTWDPMIKSHLLYQLSYAPGTGPEKPSQEGVV
jgi:hypothetical protein